MSGHPTYVNVLDHDSRLVLAHRAAAKLREGRPLAEVFIEMTGGEETA